MTWNGADFPVEELAAYRVRVVEPDGYLCGLLDAWPDEVFGTVVRLAGEKRRPPMTPGDLTVHLAKAGEPEFAQRLQTTLAG